MTDNLSLFSACREVPDNAKKPILGGRLKGKTDINPMWRIKQLTEMFGPCGIGWKTTGEQYHTEKCEGTGEIAVFCTLRLQYVDPETCEWSAPIFGIGGSMLIALENAYTADGKKTKALYLDDEAYKKANTDAISVACKQLGMGASVYWSEDNTKYTKRDDDAKSSVVNKTGVFDPRPLIASIKARYNVNDEGFASMRKALVDGGVVENKPSKEMNEADWLALKAAIDANFGDAA